MRGAHWLGGGACLGLVLFLLAGCRQSPATPGEPQWFADVTDETGLAFIHDAGPVDDRYFMPQSMGSGVALFDFDGDGLLDVYLLNNGGPKGRPNQLFRQTQAGTFVNVSAGSGLDFAGYCMGVAIGDVNNDGKPDVLVTEYGGVRLFLNNGDGTFTDVTRQAGLSNPLWGMSAAFVDYDRDGRLDLVIVNYVDYDPTWTCTGPGGAPDFCPPRPFKGTTSRLFHNLGQREGVRFQDVSFESGIGRQAGPGLGVLCADFNGDGWPDIFIANDGKPNHLWINQKDGTFKEEALLRGVAVNAFGQAEAGMGVAWADVDGDGLEDLFVTHLGSETNSLWQQGPRGMFRDRTAHSGLANPARRATGFGALFGDFNHDGAPDLLVVNGRVFKGSTSTATASSLDPFWRPYAEHNQVFINDGEGRFRDISPSNNGPAGFCTTAQVGRGLAVGDLHNTGALGVITTGINGSARLYRNMVPERGNWLVVRAHDPIRRRDALGAEITVRAGERRWLRNVHASGSYLSSSDPRAHFGLGAVEQVDAIEVLWPDGKPEASKEVFPGGAVNRHLTLERGKGHPGEG
jgi:hypothetical protein